MGMTLEADGAFHLLDAQGHSLFSLINQDSKPFQHLTLETSSTAGITLLLDVPRVEDPGSQFDRMMQVARELARELQAQRGGRSSCGAQRQGAGADPRADQRGRIEDVRQGHRPGQYAGAQIVFLMANQRSQQPR